MLNDIFIGAIAIGLFFGLFMLLDGWGDAHRQRKLNEQWQADRARQRKDRERIDKALGEPIPWYDDGLDVEKLHVKHLPPGE